MKQHLRHRSKKSTTPKKGRQSSGGYSTLIYVSRIVVGLGLIGVGVVLATFFQPHLKGANPLTSISHTSDIPDTSEILHLINTARNDIRLQSVTLDSRLTAVAQERLNDMVKRQYYAHQNLKGQYYYHLFTNHGFKTAYSCENLGIASTVEAKKFVDDWLTSTTGHKDCMLNTKVSKAGIATAEFGKTSDTEATYIVVTIYATPPMTLP